MQDYVHGMTGACNAYHSSTHLLKKAGSHAFKANGAVVLQAPHEAAVLGHLLVTQVPTGCKPRSLQKRLYVLQAKAKRGTSTRRDSISVYALLHRIRQFTTCKGSQRHE